MIEHAPFRLGRDTENVSVRVLRRWITPGGALLLPGDIASVTQADANLLTREGIVTLSKALDEAQNMKMQKAPVLKKGQA